MLVSMARRTGATTIATGAAMPRASSSALAATASRKKVEHLGETDFPRWDDVMASFVVLKGAGVVGLHWTVIEHSFLFVD